MKISKKDLIEKIKEYEELNEKDFRMQWQNDFNELNYIAGDIIFESYEEWNYDKMTWDDYKNGGYDDDIDYDNDETKWTNFLRYKKEFYNFFHPIKKGLWNTELWEEAILMIMVLVLYNNKKLICEYCKEKISERNGYFYCTIHHENYSEDPFMDTMLVHIDCHKKIHGKFKESFCKICNKPTNSSWKKYCLDCYKKIK